MHHKVKAWMVNLLVFVDPDASVLEALELMRNKGVRRLPIVNTQGDLVGLLSTDDILELVAEQLSDIVGLISHGQKKEAELRQ